MRTVSALTVLRRLVLAIAALAFGASAGWPQTPGRAMGRPVGQTGQPAPQAGRGPATSLTDLRPRLAQVQRINTNAGILGGDSPLAPGKNVLILLQENSGRVELPPGVSESEREMLFAIFDGVAEKFENFKTTLQGTGRYDRVVLLTDTNCRRAALLDNLVRYTAAGNVIDLLILGHGSDETLVLNGESLRGGVNGNIRSLLPEAQARGVPRLNLRMVFMCNCWGSTLNDDWLAAGAKVAVGSKQDNWMPEPMTTFFMQNWLGGVNAVNAAARAYDSSVPFYALAFPPTPETRYRVVEFQYPCGSHWEGTPSHPVVDFCTGRAEVPEAAGLAPNAKIAGSALACAGAVNAAFTWLPPGYDVVAAAGGAALGAIGSRANDRSPMPGSGTPLPGPTPDLAKIPSGPVPGGIPAPVPNATGLPQPVVPPLPWPAQQPPAGGLAPQNCALLVLSTGLREHGDPNFGLLYEFAEKSGAALPRKTMADRYQEIVTVEGPNGTIAGFYAALSRLAAQYQAVDLVIHSHGLPGRLQLYDALHDVTSIAVAANPQLRGMWQQAAARPGQDVALKLPSGNYLGAEGGGGAGLTAVPPSCKTTSGRFRLLSTRSPMMNGSAVQIATRTGHSLIVDGAAIRATQVNPAAAQTFSLGVTSNGALVNGSVIELRGPGGMLFVREGSGSPAEVTMSFSATQFVVELLEAPVEEPLAPLPPTSVAHLRCVLETACYGASHMQSWVNLGFAAAAGSQGVHADSQASFPAFLAYWHQGFSFGETIDAANRADAAKLWDRWARDVRGPDGKNCFSDVNSHRLVAGSTGVTIVSPPH